MGSNTKPDHIPVGDRALLIEFDNKIDPEINRRIRALYLAIRQNVIDGVIDSVPTYRSLLVYYDPLVIKFTDLHQRLREMEEGLSQYDLPKPKIYRIPVLYGGQMGPDLGFVAEHNHLSEQEVIKIHSSPKYLIYMIGFTAGFPYLGGMSSEISAPRLKKPRTKIPAGSVGIAGDQTGVYPSESPGGWRIIGRTPVKLFTPSEDPPVLLKMGNYIKFFSISESEYQEIKNKEENHNYQVETQPINQNEY